MSKWIAKEIKPDDEDIIWGDLDQLESNVIYFYHYDEETKKKSTGNPNVDGFVIFKCPICGNHRMNLPFEHGKPKERWWNKENTWQFDINDDGTFVMNPSVQIHGRCEGHFWFKQQEPRIY